MKKLVAALMLLGGGLADAQFSFTGVDYTQNFDGMGTVGTAAPVGWSFHVLGGSSGTWTTSVPATGVVGNSSPSALIATTTFNSSTLSGSAGYNFALSTFPADRALGTSPTGVAGVAHQLALTNNTGSVINSLRIGYDTRRFTAATNHLPGYWLFYSLNNGTTWTNASILNPTSATVPNATGVTTVPVTVITLAGAWGTGGELRLRWVDDNGDTSPDQIYGIDNVTVGIPVGQPPTVALTSPANNAVFTVGDTIHLTATAGDSDGTISKVEFFQGGTELYEDTSAPYEFAWTAATAGSYALRARATDSDGNSVLSGTTNITINAGPSGLLTRGPYLNQANQNSIVIRWRSSQAVVGRVRYGTSTGSLTQSADEAAATTEHIVPLTGLAPYTRYYYSIGSPLDTLAGGDAEHTFRTSPVPGTATDTRIWVLGDAGRANANQAAVRDAYYAWTGARTPDLCLMLGDNAYNAGTDAEYQAAVFNMYPTFLRKMPLWSCLGNHDANNGSTSPTANFPYFDMFTFPTNGECGGVVSGTERYFSFNYGNTHVINLDSQTSSRATIESTGSDGAMAAWLRSDLAGITATWIIAIFHHPPYSKGSHDSDTEPQLVQMRERFGRILEAGGVDLVLTGHSHSYERSFFIDGHYELSGDFDAATHKQQPGNGRPTGDGAYIKPLTGPRDHFGAVYTLTGSAGSADGGPLNHPAMFVSYNTLGSFNIDINGNTLNATYIESDNDIADTFTIIKQGTADTDRDGVADAFEIANGMNRFDNADATIDTDHDGNNALGEYLFGLNPGASDRFAWTTSLSGYDAVVTFPTLPQRTYQVFWSTDLLSWNPGSAVITGDGATQQWTDGGGAGEVRRFYHVRVKNGP